MLPTYIYYTRATSLAGGECTKPSGFPISRLVSRRAPFILPDRRRVACFYFPEKLGPSLSFSFLHLSLSFPYTSRLSTVMFFFSPFSFISRRLRALTLCTPFTSRRPPSYNIALCLCIFDLPVWCRCQKGACTAYCKKKKKKKNVKSYLCIIIMKGNYAGRSWQFHFTN